ncbi:MAG: hypothetical protein KC561_18065, partial [Myxococcales bacterium]|nr:hypothetical protein [Myxococcales bacterium]
MSGRLGVYLALSLAFAGCDGCGEARPEGRAIDAWAVDADAEALCSGAICGAGEICARERCTVPCGDDDECSIGERCTTDGYCYPEEPAGNDFAPCESDDECDSQLCNEGYCAPARTCINNSECFTDEICSLDGFCVLACTGASDCDDGEACVNGSCTAGTACVDDATCPDGACVSGVCLGACSGPEDCGANTPCIDGGCEARCAFHEDCPGEYCVHGQCTADQPPALENPIEDPVGDMGGDTLEEIEEREAECYTNLDCEDESARCEDGLCVGLEICADDNECVDGTYCMRGQCRPFCESDEDCPGEQACGLDGQ